MGSGKSTVGRLLAEHMQLPFIDLDERIETRDSMAIPDIFKMKGETYFRRRESDILMELLDSEDRFVLATGGGTPCFFDHMTLLNERCVTVYLECPPEVIENRLKASLVERPVLSNLGGKLHQHLLERTTIYGQAHIIVKGELPPIELSEYIRAKFQ
jgi:shikimate kinase